MLAMNEPESTICPIPISVGIRGGRELGGDSPHAAKRSTLAAASGLGRPPKHGIATRDRLIAGAGRLTKICGVWAAVDAVCAEADAPKASLYSVIGGKSKLLAACCVRESEEMGQLMIALAAKASDPKIFLDDLADKISAAHLSDNSLIGVSSRILQTAPTIQSYNNLPEALAAARATIETWPRQLEVAILNSGGQCLAGFDLVASDFFHRLASSLMSAGILPAARTDRWIASGISELESLIIFQSNT